jgi:hypothetical protein
MVALARKKADLPKLHSPVNYEIVCYYKKKASNQIALKDSSPVYLLKSIVFHFGNYLFPIIKHRL